MHCHGVIHRKNDKLCCILVIELANVTTYTVVQKTQQILINISNLRYTESTKTLQCLYV